MRKLEDIRSFLLFDKTDKYRVFIPIDCIACAIHFRLCLLYVFYSASTLSGETVFILEDQNERCKMSERHVSTMSTSGQLEPSPLLPVHHLAIYKLKALKAEDGCQRSR
jgi:hypothetical protein